MDLRKLFNINYYKNNFILYKEKINKDYEINASFRNGLLTKEFLKGYEWKYIKCYRHFQANKDNLWGRYYKKKLNI